ncbi:hypothetical protein AX15_004400 [Amanita polypyramis BW_CC]|nr:hypothetical protein AX15_004400 [Amanita polypyramis BW_CC]
MLYIRVHAPFLLVLLVIVVISASASELKVRLTGPEHIDRVEDLKVISTITNAGTKSLDILHDPHGLLSDLPTDKFSITNHWNAQPRFTGVRAKFSPIFAIESGAYTTLEPGQSIAIEHDLSKAYDFSTSGAGEYTIRASGCFYVVDALGDAIPSYAEIAHHIAKIGVKLVLPQKKPVPERRPKFAGCTASQESQIASAIPVAERYVQNAFDHLQSHNSGTPRYTTWFGQYNSERHSTALSHFEKIHGNNFSSFTFVCFCSRPGTFAYVAPDQSVLHPRAFLSKY